MNERPSNRLSPEAEAAEFVDRVRLYRVAREGAHVLRGLLEKRGDVWAAGSGRLRERDLSAQLTLADAKNTVTTRQRRG